ncbi:type II secretion system F family protein [Vibrio sp. AND4]|uniref:type II secretion system F family protein n=1 Tax=Vibrio sp. AND4 TaxID=314289 RepID=UPI00015EF6E6|nr:type II secretion system F family protein [Vibrio sp. AND4]EDP57602.1 type IV pilin biogenesis protein PilC [Vibrio sp. AND4]
MKIVTPQLKNYRWKGINRSGKKISGNVLAITELEVREHLDAQHITIKKLKKGSISFITKFNHRIKGKDVTVFTRQITTMLMTGVPIVQALKLVAKSHKKAEMKSTLMSITRAVEAGTPISKAMGTTSKHFDPLYTNLIATGEQSGNLPQVFDRLATYREKSEQLRARVAKALIYPTMVILVALGVCYLMLTQVIPEFEKMFVGFGADLPAFTQTILDLSAWIQNWGHLAGLVFFILLIYSNIMVSRSAPFKLLLARWSLNIPILGPVLSKAAIARFSRTLATSFSSGIPILIALKTTSKISGNMYYQLAIEDVYRDTAAGMPMYVAMRNGNVFPELVWQMVMIGEESGRLDDMLNKIATIYEFEVDSTVDNLSKILEPLLIIFLGVVIGGLVIAMYLPIFNLMSVIG